MSLLENFTVLYIEDDISAQENMRLLLDDEVKELYQAYDGVDGLELYKEEKPDIIILDFNMPNMDGLELSRAIKEIDSEQYIMILSAFEDIKLLKNSINSGVNYFIAKPLTNIKIFFNELNRVCQNIQIKQENRLLKIKLDKRLSLINKCVVYSKTDLDGIITDISDAFLELSGYSRDELIGNRHSILRSSDVDSSLYKNLWDTIQDNKQWYGEIKNINKFGSEFWISSHIYPEFDNNNHKIGYIAISNNITEKKNLEKQKEYLLKQDKILSLENLLQNIAHQWRQPLSIISTAATSLELEQEYGIINGETILKNSNLIEKQTRYLSSIIDDFIKMKENVVTKENIKLEDLIVKVKYYLDMILQENNIELVVNIDEDKILETYESALIQTIIKICDNSKEAFIDNSIDNRVIFITSHITKDDKIILKIRDNAGGIDNSIINNVFEPYFTTKHKSVGKGLGLYSVYDFVVHQIGGKISLSNIEFEYQNKQYKGVEVVIEMV